MLYRPAQIAIVGLVVWFAVWLALPVDVRLPMRWNTVGFIALGYACFIGGCLWAQRAADHAQLDSLIAADPWRRPLLSGLFWASFGLGALAMALRLYDRIIIRGLDYTADADEVRETLAATDFSFASVVSSVFLPLCFLPFILLLASRWERGHAFKLILATLLASLPMGESLLQASRSVMLLTAMMMFFAVCLLKFGGKVLSRKTLLPLAAGLAALTVVSGAIFSGRVEAYGRTVEETVFSSVYAEAFTPKPIAQQALRSGDPLIEAVAETGLPLGMYYVSGFYEFDMAYNRPDEQLFAFGSYIFYPYSRVIAVVFGQENIRGLNDERIIFRAGTFTSFFGPLWVDFGFFIFPVLIMLGYSSQRMAVLAARGYVNVIPIYLLFSVAVFYMPVFNFLTNGFGFFTFNAYLLFWLFSSFGIKEPVAAPAGGEASQAWPTVQAK
jgi:hypothetical protein